MVSTYWHPITGRPVGQKHGLSSFAILKNMFYLFKIRPIYKYNFVKQIVLCVAYHCCLYTGVDVSHRPRKLRGTLRQLTSPSAL